LLLELPHELYFDLLPLVCQLQRIGIQSILSHPERNHGLLAHPEIVGKLVEHGCLMQVTCGSLLGTFGKPAQRMAEAMIKSGDAHILATDAHGSQARRPRMAAAFQRATELAGMEIAKRICCLNPALVAAGQAVAGGRIQSSRRRSWFGRQAAA
jgi:protein-tyrosine phosphatase